jgi:hypothetical protein
MPDELAWEQPTVDSDSEGDGASEKEPISIEENMYLEEIKTYQQRRTRLQPLVVDCHTMDGSVEEELLSNEENAPEIEE